MAVLKMKPTSAGRRFQTVSDFAEITRSTPEKSLTEGLTKKSGRNNNGRVTSRRRGGGHKRLYRLAKTYLVAENALSAIAVEHLLYVLYLIREGVEGVARGERLYIGSAEHIFLLHNAGGGIYELFHNICVFPDVLRLNTARVLVGDRELKIDT